MVLVLFLMLSCATQTEKSTLVPLEEYIPKIPYPEDNPPNKELAEFGKMLFFDKTLSLDSSISCASCHSAKFGLADNLQLSRGVGDSLGLRNAPTLINVAYQPYFFADGGVPALEMQVMAPLQDENEMHLPILKGAERLKQNKKYNELAHHFFQRDIDPYVITRAIANFERTFLSFDARYDRYARGDKSALNAQEIRGMNLFFSDKVDCKSCHPAPLFTNFAFENVGHIRPDDLGRMRITGDSLDWGKFKVPTLRGISQTAPYFYDGTEKDLNKVVDFFLSGGGKHPNKTKLLKQVELTEQERQDLVEFLRVL